ncbi:hypothetical protein [Shumkonia mesophila]|uniref:hypothetical protein n=1 Tax=Shumkonia mesophila TaxID=2838854 RepID=UPI00293487F2|nr:hypothetical protein [Shumkonia mesophila]
MKNGKNPACPGVILAAVAAAGLLLVSACQTGPVDSGGRGMQLTEWKIVDVAEVDLTLPLLIAPKVTKAEYQCRDNNMNHHRLQLDGGKGGIYTQYVVASLYGEETEKSLNDVEKFKTFVSDFVKGDLAGFDEVREVKHGSKKSAGFVTIADVKNPVRDKCIFARVGYRLKGRTVYDNDFGNLDTAIDFWYCDPNVKFDDFSRALETVGLVGDRAAFAAALAAK